MKKALVPLLLLTALSGAAVSCASLSKVELQEGQYILDSYKIEVSDDPFFNVSELSPYVRQKPDRSFLSRKAVILDKNDAGSSRLSIGERLAKLGYYGSKVDTVITRKGNKAKVVYRVDLGQRFPIDSIAFERAGASEEFVSDFFADSSKILVRKGDFLSEVVMEEEIARSVEALKRKGYYSVDQSQYHFRADTNGRAGKVAVIYELPSRVHKSHIGNVSVSYPEELKIRESVLKGMNLIKPGDLYNSRIVSNTYSRFSSLRVFQSVGVNLTPVDSTTVDCNISLAQSKLQGFKTNLEVSTNSSGLIGVSPRVNYYHKNIFGGGEWLSIGFSGNFQFMVDDDTHATEVGTSASLSLPKFLGLGYERFRGPSVPRTEFNLSFSHQNRPEYTRNLFSGSFGYTGIYRRRFSYQVYPLQIGYVRLFNLNPAFASRLNYNPYMKYSYQDHSDVGVAGTFYYTNSPDPIPTTSYYTIRLQADLSGNVISLFKGMLPANSAGQGLLLGAPFSQYSRIELAFARGYRFGLDDEQTLAFRLLGGIGQAYGNSTAMPYEKQFYAGGASSMRGWQTRSLGPGSSPMDKTFSIPSQTGDMKLEADVEYRFPLFWMLEGALFAEAGNIWDTHSSVKLSDIAADYGLGLRLNVKSLILIRVDLGVRLRDPSAETVWLDPITAFKNGGAALHFGVGYPF